MKKKILSVGFLVMSIACSANRIVPQCFSPEGNEEGYSVHPHGQGDTSYMSLEYDREIRILYVEFKKAFANVSVSIQKDGVGIYEDNLADVPAFANLPYSLQGYGAGAYEVSVKANGTLVYTTYIYLI